jgi:hypothetical protein
VLSFYSKFFHSNNIDNIYSKDWRKVWRNAFYRRENKEEETPKKDFMDSKTLAYLLATGKAKPENFKQCSEPLGFVLNWLAYNGSSFWDGNVLNQNLDLISWCDVNKYNFKPIYLQSSLLELIPSESKGFMKFPPFKTEKETITESNISHSKKDKKKKKESLDSFITPKKEYKGLKSTEELGDFLLP